MVLQHYGLSDPDFALKPATELAVSYGYHVYRRGSALHCVMGSGR
jgi:hypothetical protein